VFLELFQVSLQQDRLLGQFLKQDQDQQSQQRGHLQGRLQCQDQYRQLLQQDHLQGHLLYPHQGLLHVHQLQQVGLILKLHLCLQLILNLYQDPCLLRGQGQ